jgi:biopolymer transport protein ExbD
LLAAPLAAVFLLLMFLVVGLHKQESKGIELIVARSENNCPIDFQYGANRSVVLQLKSDGSTSINMNQISEQELRTKLQLIYRNRDQKIVFIRIDDSVSVEQAANFIDMT